VFGHLRCGDVPDHDGLDAGTNELLVDPSERRTPFGPVERVVGGGQVLVPLVDAVARKVLCRAGDSRFARAEEVLDRALGDELGFIAERSSGDHGVPPVEMDVGDRREQDVAADRARLAPRDAPQLPRDALVRMGPGLQVRADERAVDRAPEPAHLRVGGDQERGPREPLRVPDVLSALARALRLSAAEREHLYLLAGQPAPGPGQVSAHIPSGSAGCSTSWTAHH
jgi:hypothetical protein